MSRIGYSGIGPASASAFGSMSPTNFTQNANWFGKAVLNILDYGGDPTGTNDNVAAFTAMQAATAPAFGAMWVIPPGTYKMASAFTITVQGVTVEGCNWAASVLSSSNTTSDTFVVNNWYTSFNRLMFTNSVTKALGYCINAPAGYDYCDVSNCFFQGASSGSQLFRGINMGNLIMTIRDCRMINVSDAYVVVSAASNANQYIHALLTSNPTQLTTGGIVINSTGSLTMSDLDIVNGGPGALLIAPTTGTSIPSVNVVNSYFDTSTNGLSFNPAGTGNVVRSKFTNCWFGNNTGAGIVITAAGGGIDGITFSNCDFYNNGTAFNGAVAPGGSIDMLASRFAGNTVAVSLAGSASTYWQFANNHIGAQAGFGVNGTGIVYTTGTYGGLRIQNNYCEGNTTNFTRGTVTMANYTNYRITDNAGINPLQPLAQPTLAATTVATVNNTGLRCSVFITAVGTATVHSVNGVATGLVAGTVGASLGTVDPGGTITMTYTAAPTLVWIGN